MAETAFSLFNTGARSDWVRLRTLILLRWLAIAGQTATVAVSSLWLDLVLPVDLCAFAIAASVGFNIVLTLIHPETKRLSERDTALTLMFDLAQLGVLLFLCGGLTNPFSVLVLAPVTISATALTLRTTLAIGVTALMLITFLAVAYIPLRFTSGVELVLPNILIAGMWAALLIGVAFLAVYARRVTVESFTMSQALLATQMALAREQRLTALGGLVAAAAHELGTPLATIKLVSTELAREVRGNAELLEDVELIRSQTDRCRDILRSLGRAGKDDSLLRVAPISAVIQEAAEPHAGRGKRIILRLDGAVGALERDQPEIPRQPEIIHGLRNLIQNAVDFARAHVWIDVDWDDDAIRIAVGDDGPGYAPEMLGRLGDPFLRRRADRPAPDAERPEYEGMGLGLFIAKTLLERSGARLTFANGSERPPTPGLGLGADPELTRPTGALVEVVWPRARVAASRGQSRGPLGQNRPFDLRKI